MSITLRFAPVMDGRRSAVHIRRTPTPTPRSAPCVAEAPVRRLLAGLLPGVLLLVGTVALPSPAAVADETTVSDDTLRTGWDQNEAGPEPVRGIRGRLRPAVLDHGQRPGVRAADRGQRHRHRGDREQLDLRHEPGDRCDHLVAQRRRRRGRPRPLGCGDLVPNIGITSTPVYDPATGSVFFMAKVNDGPDAAAPALLHALDRPGHRRRALRLAGHDPGHAEQRPGRPVQPGDRRRSGPACCCSAA